MCARRRIKEIVLVGVALLVGTTPGWAGVVGTYQLGLPNVVGSVAEFSLALEFAADGGESLVFMGLDLSNSTGALTAGGTDFSRFSFAKSSPLLDDWDPIPGTGFSASSALLELDTVIAPLPVGNHVIGLLSVDYAGSGLVPGDISAFTFLSSGTVIGTEIPGNPGSFGFTQAGYVAVPEMGSLALGIFGISFCGAALWRRRGAA